MKNPLEQLREDVVTAGHEAYEECENETDGCLAALDTFIEKYEAVEVLERELGSPTFRRWDNRLAAQAEDEKRQAILVPRTQEPTLLEVMKRVEAVMDKVNSTDVADFMSARAALSEAISKEQSE